MGYMPGSEIVLARSPRARPPRPSHLGEADLPWIEDAEVLVGNAMRAEHIAAALAGRRLLMARDFQAELDTSRAMQQTSQPPLQKQRTVCMTESKSKVRGVDPLAGSLF